MERRALAPNYFLVAISDRHNHELSIEYALAGFPR
jgi:hypothetical protein